MSERGGLEVSVPARAVASSIIEALTDLFARFIEEPGGDGHLACPFVPAGFVALEPVTKPNRGPAGAWASAKLESDGVGEGADALFTIEPEPLSWFATIVRLLCFTAAVLVFSCYRIRKVEITYTTD